jgi:hypothetical protein
VTVDCIAVVVVGCVVVVVVDCIVVVVVDKAGDSEVLLQSVCMSTTALATGATEVLPGMSAVVLVPAVYSEEL